MLTLVSSKDECILLFDEPATNLHRPLMRLLFKTILDNGFNNVLNNQIIVYYTFSRFWRNFIII